MTVTFPVPAVTAIEVGASGTFAGITAVDAEEEVEEVAEEFAVEFVIALKV